MYKIMIIEDDKALCEITAEYISSWNYEVYCATDFNNILSEFESVKPQLVLLDISLPFYNGYHWCKEIRRISNVPIVFLSSASDNLNIVTAMNMGGDDFIAKPVEPMVLAAKIGAVIRRVYDMTEKQYLSYGGAVLDLSDSSLDINGQQIELTKNEFRILHTLMQSKGKIVSRDTLMMKLWQDDCYVEENTLTVNVTRLRKKLDAAGLTDFIKTRKGSGYIIE